ncbi:MAG: hypothetical protein J7K39_09380 [Bacteroidales bacterium]|nr:hypothetical protein [Bacteroidales bacterium]
MKFIRQKDSSTAVLVVQPFSLDMYNNNKYNLDSINIPKGYSLDSLLFQQTHLLKHISDSIFLESYLNSFINSLRKNGFQVFLPDELEAFKNVLSPAYIFRFAQVELSEEIDPYVISEDFSGNNLYKSFDLNLVTLSNWFEFEARDTAWRKIFFAEDAISDEISGDVFLDKRKNTPVLYYNIDSLSVKEVYQMATDVGEKYASYLTDFLMNSYIKKHFPSDLKPKVFFHYDAELKMLFSSFKQEEGFQEIEK